MRKFTKPIVVISKCIEFDHCRWNGAIIKNDYIGKLKPFVQFQSICPEVEIGLGVPRKSIRIVKKEDGLHLMQNETGMDVTEKMENFTQSALKSIDDVDGFILKENSPSCGTKGIKIYPYIGKVAPLSSKGKGFFGGAVEEKFGHLAIENEGRLNNFTIREHFFTKLFTLASFRKLKQEKSMKNLVQFQSENKYLLMAYNQISLKKLGKIVGNQEKKPVEEVWENYEQELYNAFAKIPSFKSIINVLMHCMGYFSDNLSKEEKEFFLDSLEQYRNSKVPLSVCIAILKSWIIRFDEKYLKQQTFLNPYPEELVEITDSGKGRNK